MKSETLKQKYLDMFNEKSNILGRLPKKSDFDNQDVVKIKSIFGTWPNALEQAGLIAEKSVRQDIKRKKHGEKSNEQN